LTDAGLLEGIRVVEVATFAAGPTAGAILGDLGADVIHVEEPGQGDPYREFVSQAWLTTDADRSYNASWELVNRNKRSLALSLKTEVGREVFDKLLERSDVFVTNMLPSVRERLAITATRLRQRRPTLIYVSITGYGGRGPLRERRSFDFGAFWAASGIMGLLGQAQGTPPMQRPGMGDRTVGAFAAGAVGLALYHRERTGEGQLVELSLLHSGMWVIGSDIQRTATLGEPGPREPRTAASNPMWNSYRTKDDSWLITTVRPNFDWATYCEAIGRAELSSDERFRTSTARSANRIELIKWIEDAFAERTRIEWRDRLERYGVTWSPVLLPGELIDDEQVTANNTFFETEPPGLGHQLLLRPPFHFDATPTRFDRRAPRLGEHSAEILGELGYNTASIESMTAKGAVGLAEK
jgi:crotonobetainyl-CoA:carnitine CoA-transferase CaiB-like acyl-CoA transferase